MSRREAVIALTRFGMGAMPREIRRVSKNPKRWLLRQVNDPRSALLVNKKVMNTGQSARFVINGIAKIKESKAAAEVGELSEDALSDVRRETIKSYHKVFESEIHNRNRQAMTTKAGFAERWVRFWSNHFSVSAREPNLFPLVNAFEREAIRPFVFGKFSDLLISSTFHPAMLYYLNNNVSVGPTSQAVEWAKSVGRPLPGLNENLAREILELHTLGVGAGYQQSDVLAFAQMLTGWTILGLPSILREEPADIGDVIFYSKKHEKREQIFLNKFYPAIGADQAKMALNDLAKNPSTARHISTKLVRHFVEDDINPADVEALESVFLETQGDLKKVAKALINLDSMWSGQNRKFKTPEELVISTARALGKGFRHSETPTQYYDLLGQVPFSAGSPDGWPDVADEWLDSDAIKKRIEWAYEISADAEEEMTGTKFLKNALGRNVSKKTLEAVSRAESVRASLALAIMSPEFQRR